jgi:uncharacterized protein YbaA (DUF1428 family)
MTYIDGFVFVVKKKNLAAYKKMAALGGKVWKKHGALSYKECIGDDLNMEHIKLTFPKLTKAKKDEVVCFSYITYKSKAHRDKVNAAVMKDPSMSPEAWKDKEMPFDMNRMSAGGFESFVDL